jgi:hypothetical protein
MNDTTKAAGHIGESEKWKLIQADGKEVEILSEDIDAHFAGKLEDGSRLVNASTNEEAWMLRDKRGEVVAISRTEPNTARFLALIVAEMFKQTELLEGIKKTLDADSSEIYLSDISEGQDDVKRLLGELADTASVTASSIDSVDDGVTTLVDYGVKIQKAKKR